MAKTTDVDGTLTWTQKYVRDNVGRVTNDTFKKENGGTSVYDTSAIRGYTATSVQNSLTYKLNSLTKFTQTASVDGLDRVYRVVQNNTPSGKVQTALQEKVSGTVV